MATILVDDNLAVAHLDDILIKSVCKAEHVGQGKTILEKLYGLFKTGTRL